MIDPEAKRARERSWYRANIDTERERKRLQQQKRRQTEDYRRWNREHKRFKRATDIATKEKSKIYGRRNNLRKFGLTEEQYEALLEQQGSVCAICRQPEKVRDRRLAVDHCHESGIIRGLLCHNCNVALGLLKDSEDVLAKAIAYLSVAKQKSQPQK